MLAPFFFLLSMIKLILQLISFLFFPKNKQQNNKKKKNQKQNLKLEWKSIQLNIKNIEISNKCFFAHVFGGEGFFAHRQILSFKPLGGDI